MGFCLLLFTYVILCVCNFSIIHFVVLGQVYDDRYSIDPAFDRQTSSVALITLTNLVLEDGYYAYIFTAPAGVNQKRYLTIYGEFPSTLCTIRELSRMIDVWEIQTSQLFGFSMVVFVLAKESYAASVRIPLPVDACVVASLDRIRILTTHAAKALVSLK